MTALQIAGELETFKMAHGRGQVITEAVNLLRKQNGELERLRDVEAKFKKTLSWVQKTVGRDMKGVLIPIRPLKGLKPWRFPNVSEVQEFNNMMSENHLVMPSVFAWK